MPDTVGDSEMPIFIFQEQRKGRTGSIEERGQINDGQELGGFLREGPLAGVGLWGSRKNLSLMALLLKGTYPGTNMVTWFCKICKI